MHLRSMMPSSHWLPNAPWRSPMLPTTTHPPLTPWWIEFWRQTTISTWNVGSLRQSCVGNLLMTIPRLASSVHVVTCQIFNLIQTMLHVKIPIWFYWGSYKTGLPKLVQKGWQFVPIPDEVSALLMCNAHPPTLLLTTGTQAPPPSPSTWTQE